MVSGLALKLIKKLKNINPIMNTFKSNKKVKKVYSSNQDKSQSRDQKVA